ncbi:amidohydrolase [Glutamicibacter uratoxydans]|uniref:Amidohydrolase n=1 Tax=Glutamicibacter uratoxydans TaxID=43667 RepID=A0A4Y4DN17_GLUUR|nr:amidohydrolase family protein [Glutamicibacter uratoxydans]GED04738.1 amidohydrolase [Glutamicibacter uratoxydans]
MAKTLYHNGSVYSSADPFATAIVIDGDTVAWLGGEEAAERHAETADQVIDLNGALITPAFVESHTHLAALGRALSGADLSAAGSAGALLELVAARAAGTEGFVTAQGWDESAWDRAELPSEAELTEAAGGRGYYLVRRDVHSALVNSQLLVQLGLGHIASGQVRGTEHDQVRAALAAANPEGTDYQQLALRHYAQRGFGTVVEMAAPQLEGREALDALLAADDASLPQVYAFWGELAADGEQAKDLVASFPAGRILGLGGDLRVDGSLGSRTAYLREDYADDAGNRGQLYLSEEQITAHLVSCSQQGIQAAFHVIGDGALDLLLDAFDAAAEQIGVAKLQMCRHRIEHAEMVDDASRQRLLQYSIMVSMQPQFDAQWGGEQGMYEARLGQRAAGMNNLSAMLSSGVPLVLGSDAPVTEVDGWKIVRAAMNMSSPEARISARAAFLAQTRSTYRAMGQMNPTAGQLVIGAAATFAIWSASELAVQTPDVRISSWSTDARAGTPMLPVVDEHIPNCLRTVRDGNILFDRLDPASIRTV